MAQLTWRNVDAPNMSGSLDGIRIASGLLGNATDSLSQGLASFGKAQQQRADSAALQGALQYNDPAAYQEALRNGSILGGIDTSQVSPETMAALSNRSAQLIENAGQQQRQDVTGYAFDRTKVQNTATDAARNVIGQIYTAQQQGDQGTVNRLLQENSGVLGALSPEEQANLYKTGGDVAGQRLTNIGQALGNQGRSIGNQDAGLSLDLRRASVNDQNQVTGVINNIMGSVLPGDADGARAIAESQMRGLSTQGQALLRSALNQQFPGTYNGGSGTGTGGATTNPYDMVYGNGQFGTPDKAPSQMTIGEVQDFGKNTLIPATRGQVGAGADKGTSATGAFQFTQSTLDNYGPKVFGADYKTTQFTPENQEKLAQAAFEDNKGGDLSKIWTSLPNNTAGAYKDVPWSQMRQLIAGGESGALPDRVPASAQQNQDTAVALDNTQRSIRAGQNTSQQQWLDTLSQTQGDKTTSASDAVDGLLKGSLKGTNRGYLLNTVNRIVQQTGYTPATAAKMLESNLEDSNNIFQRAGHAVRTLGGLVRNDDSTPDLGQGVRINDSGLANAIDLSKTNAPVQTILNQRDLQQQTQITKQAQDALTKAQNDYNTLIQRIPSQPGLRSQLARYQNNLAMAQANFNQVAGRSLSDPNNAPLTGNQQNPNLVPPSLPQPVATSVGSPRTNPASQPQAASGNYNQQLLETYGGLRR